MSYGSAAGVAALSALYADATTGTFTTTTTPTLAQVNTWITEVSQVVDSALADEGFETPITDTDITQELALLVEGIVKELVNYSHDSGRFFSTKALESGVSPFMTIDTEIHNWVKRKSVGFELQGATKIGTGRNVASFDLL